MQLHPRRAITVTARNKFSAFLHDLIAEHDLTYGEIVEILSGALNQEAQNMH